MVVVDSSFALVLGLVVVLLGAVVVVEVELAAVVVVIFVSVLNVDSVGDCFLAAGLGVSLEGHKDTTHTTAITTKTAKNMMLNFLLSIEKRPMLVDRREPLVS